MIKTNPIKLNRWYALAALWCFALGMALSYRPPDLPNVKLTPIPPTCDSGRVVYVSDINAMAVCVGGEWKPTVISGSSRLLRNGADVSDVSASVTTSTEHCVWAGGNLTTVAAACSASAKTSDTLFTRAINCPEDGPQFCKP